MTPFKLLPWNKYIFHPFFFLLYFFCGEGAFTVVVVVICSIVQNFLSIRDYLFKENILVNSKMNQLAPVTLKLRKLFTLKML